MMMTCSLMKRSRNGSHMAEWVRTNDGRPLKTTDALLEKIQQLMVERDLAYWERDEAIKDLALNRSSRPEHVRI